MQFQRPASVKHVSKRGRGEGHGRSPVRRRRKIQQGGVPVQGPITFESQRETQRSDFYDDDEDEEESYEAVKRAALRALQRRKTEEKVVQAEQRAAEAEQKDVFIREPVHTRPECSCEFCDNKIKKRKNARGPKLKPGRSHKTVLD